MTTRIIRPSREPRLAHQIEARRSTKRMILQSGALGSGKTFNMARWMLERVLLMPGSAGAAGAGNYRQTEVTIKAEFDALLNDLPEVKACLEVRGDIRQYAFHVRKGMPPSLVYWYDFVGSNPREVGENLKSLSLTWAAVEEVDRVAKSTLDNLNGRVRWRPDGTKYPMQLLLSCNPRSQSHYLYDMFFRNPSEFTQLVRSKTRDNPFLPRDFEAQIRSSFSAETAKRYLEGEWVGRDGQIFADFSAESHVYHVPPDENTIVQRWAGLDFGGAHPHVIVWFAMDYSGRIWQEREWVRAQVGLEYVAEQLRRHPVPYIYRDHDLADGLTLQNHFGINGLVRANKERSGGIATISKLLEPTIENGRVGRPKLMVHASCKETIRQLGGITYEQADKKLDDDVFDSVRYALHTHLASAAIRPSVYQMRY